MACTVGAAEKSKPRPLPPVTAKAFAAAPALIGPGDATLGKEKADSERCIECHGPQGQGLGHSNGPEGKFPKLAGQNPQYLLKQLDNFRTGARQNEWMAVMATNVADADLRDIAAYFASQPRMQGDGEGGNPAGQALFLQGDASRGIPACASCHGEHGQGSSSPGGLQVPMIGGQEWIYLEKQLLGWRSNWRDNSPGGVMHAVTRALTDADITALTSHLASLR
ncbi:MAG: cytochrome c [Leptothrix sp. (in: b-proteobacteria)]